MFDWMLDRGWSDRGWSAKVIFRMAIGLVVSGGAMIGWVAHHVFG
jgi:hypothetical protein